MASITRYYGITGKVEFLDVEVSTDNRLFVDPHAIRLQPGTLASDANECTETFFDEITRCVVSPKVSDQQRGLELLQQFMEPKETRLGYTKEGIDGHGTGDAIGETIWHALSTDLRAFLDIGILKMIEDMPVFVGNVAEDRTSDLTTRIVFDPLARFTSSQVARHPEFTSGGHRTQSFRRQVWDLRAINWVDKDLVLPVADGKPLVLVPRNWARPRLLMSSARYFDTIMLGFAQERATRIDATTGKSLKPPKWSLRRQKRYARGIDTIVRVTTEAYDLNEDLVSRFRNFVDMKYEPLSDDDIARHTGSA